MCVCADSPRITHPPRNQRVVDNGIVSFHCLATGNPVPDVYWRRSGRRIVGSVPSPVTPSSLSSQSLSLATGGGGAGGSRGRYYVIEIPHGSLLRIEPAKSRRDDGTVECVADNGSGDPVVASATVEVYAEGLGE